MKKAELERIFDQNFTRYLDEWKEFLRFQSVSTDAAYHTHCVACAEWVAEKLRTLGFVAELIQTSGKPVVFAERKGVTGAPTALYYGHYDVQPVDPVELWATDPFEPVLKEGRLYARGAQDNKGQTHYFLKAVEALIEAKALRATLKVVLEGEEECGSPGITSALPTFREKLAADILMVCDTGTVLEPYASITMGLRGIIHFEARLGGLTRDLHSGVHGGLVKNPATEMARLIASLHNPDGSVAVPGFYDDVVPVNESDRKAANSFSIPAEHYKAKIGVLPLGGEASYTFMERRGFRPTIEVNGMYSGYQGQGSKTIIPSFAVAKFSSRLVAKQDPTHTLEQITGYLRAKAPAELEFSVPHSSVGGAALLLSSDAPEVKKAKAILDEIMGTETVLLWEGASIPLIPSLMEATGGAPILVGFGLEEDNIHAPNESFAVQQYKRGFLYAGMFLGSL